ncbi:S9 family peptidase [uncultured Pontibacter sp.]|uniref:S9 family peptidase n=1 Tax=uncultured Pontibacter sp. TaxID=453356 RepID=UPI00261868AC|nr:S9 family peptidase [uncultured Pontibacter sp.]
MKKVFQAAALAALLVGCQSPGSEQGQTTETATAEAVAPVKTYSIEEFMATTSIRGNAISPDNSKILFSSNETGIYNAFEVPTSGGEPKQLTDSKDNSVFVISYFPADERILYASDQGGNEITHLYMRNLDGTSRDLTPDAKAKAGFAGWSHDKQSFFYISNKRDARMFDLYEMDLKSFTPKLVYQNDQALDVAAISRDKRYLGLVKSINTNKSDMYLYDTQTKQLKQLTKGQGDVKYSPETFTPDSKKMYFLTDEDREYQALKSYDLATGKTEDVEQTDWDIMYSYFSRNGKYRVTGINKDARTEIKIYEVASGQPVKLPTMPAGDITGVNFSDDERLMSFFVNSSKSPSNLFVYRFDGNAPSQLTNTMNPSINSDDLVEGEVIRYTSYDGMEVPALLYKPKGIKAGEKRPAVLWIHGGPGGQTRLNYSPLMQYIVNHGYVLLAVNNRGSSGYGKTFFAADDQKHGDVDLKDCIESKKFLAATGYVDEDKIGIMGGSYGGYMVLAGLAFAPDEFAVGVNIFGVSNWLRTLQSIPPWWESFREALYKEMGNPKTDSAALYNKSPLFFAHQIKKPLIVLQGANDPRVLQVESDEIVEAVKKNNVPVEYIVFPDEGHGFVKKENEIKGYSAILTFLDTYLKGEPADQAGSSGQ